MTEPVPAEHWEALRTLARAYPTAPKPPGTRWVPSAITYPDELIEQVGAVACIAFAMDRHLLPYDQLGVLLTKRMDDLTPEQFSVLRPHADRWWDTRPAVVRRLINLSDRLFPRKRWAAR